MDVSIGIGIGKRRCDTCVVNQRGRVLVPFQYPNTASGARKFAQRVASRYGAGRCRAACETAASMWNITFDAFEGAGIEIKLANTFHMAIMARTGKKTDRVDAQKIAQVLRMDMIPECYVPDAPTRGVRAMVRQRVRLAWDRTRVTSRTHSLPGRHDLRIEASNMYCAKAIGQMESATLNLPQDEIVLRQYARQIRHLTGEITRMEGLLDKEASKNADARLLASLTGLGTYTALLPATDMADISRFDAPKRPVSWAGLCPAIQQSGDRRYMGRIKKIDRSSLVCWAMCEAANTAVRHDDRMRVAYELARRRHAGKHAPAIIAVANKMITIAWHILKTRTPYASRNERLYRRKLTRMERAGNRRKE